MLIALLCALRGTAFLYEGEELGLPEAEIPYERIQDPWGRFLWPQWQGRDGCRTPMPWDEKQKNCGFTAAPEPWLPIPPAHCALAVAAQDKNEESTLAFTRAFLAWRKNHAALARGGIEFLDSEESLLAFRRVHNGETMLCVFNCGGAASSFPRLGVEKDVFEWPGANWHIVGERIMLPGFGFFIGRMQEE
jgi:alpha-glucosidase